MPTILVMDENTESIFRQLLGLSLDKPIPAPVRRLWGIAIAQRHAWLSGGPLSEPILECIALMYTVGVVTRCAGTEDKIPEQTSKKEKHGSA